jgi:hypothetical protein
VRSEKLRMARNVAQQADPSSGYRNDANASQKLLDAASRASPGNS